jgi:L-ascorbate 6-phosphate lactonase
VRSTEVRPGTLVVWWLYQSGLLVKSPHGAVIAIDPYLSDAVLRSYRLPRNVPPPLDPAEAEPDALLATHSHEDHLDPDSIRPLLSSPRSRFVGPPMAVGKVLAAGIAAERTAPVARGDVVSVSDLTVRAVHARHTFAPEPTPDAVGFVVECGGVSLYHSGDTEYDSEIVLDTRGVTASFISINGTGGNMNAHEAALLAWRQGAGLAVPFHYGLWRDADYGEGATLDPGLFVGTYRRLSPHGRTLVLEPARAVIIGDTGLAG